MCNEPVSGKKNVKLPSAVPPPIPMSPIVEKMEGLKAIRNRSNSLRLGRLAFYRHLEKVETMRSFWELKHVEMEQGKQQVMSTDFILLTHCTPQKNCILLLTWGILDKAVHSSFKPSLAKLWNTWVLWVKQLNSATLCHV